VPKVQPIASGNGNGRGRRARAARVTTTLAEINVIPLVDVMLVLLIIFMVTAPMMQQGLNVNLPRARRAQPVSAEPIYVTVPLTYRDNRVVQIDQDPVRIEILHERVKQALLARDDKSVFLRGDGGVTLQELMQVMDKLKEAGVEKVGIVSRPPDAR
jgi:biopolymer transport protein ExbD